MTSAVFDVLATVRALREQGLGYRLICHRLTEMGISPPGGGKKWHDQQIKRMCDSGAVSSGTSGRSSMPTLPPVVPRLPPEAPPTAAPATEAPQLPAVIERPRHDAATLAWYEQQLDDMQRAQNAALTSSGRLDATGIASLGRRVEELAERIRAIRERDAAASSTGLSLADRLHRLGEAARKMPDGMIEIFVGEWCSRHRVDMVALRDARLVRAGGDE